MAEPFVEIDGVIKRFRVEKHEITALDGISARVMPGRITGLVGPDGAGKTTLMRLVADLLRPDEGEIRVLGKTLSRHGEIRDKIGYMPQRFGLYEDLSVAENLNLYADLHGVAADARDKAFKRLLRFTGLAPFTTRLAGQLSGGMKQKLGLACTLIGDPKVLLLDEPSVGVDPVSRRELWSIVGDLAHEGVCLLWSTAYLDEADRCDEVILLNEGNLLAQGRPGDFSGEMVGRVYAVSIEGEDKRDIQRRAAKVETVVDSIIQGRRLRLVVKEGAPPPSPAVLGLPDGKEVRSVAPRFEDAFISILKERHGHVAHHDLEMATHVPSNGAISNGNGSGDRRHVIETQDLTREFGSFRAVDRISFHVGQGEIFGLLGPNGAGKSTTFKMLCGLLVPTSGSAHVAGIDLRHAPAEARNRIGYMSQKFSLYENLTVRENLEFFSGVYGLSGTARQARIQWMLDEFDLDPFADTKSIDISLGYKQRLALGCALTHEPAILFLDEPTSGVDPLTRREFWTRINAMADAGVTVLVTSHFMDEAEYCDRLGIVYRGQIIAAGAPDDLKRQHSSKENPDPTLEEVFVALIENYDRDNPS